MQLEVASPKPRYKAGALTGAAKFYSIYYHPRHFLLYDVIPNKEDIPFCSLSNYKAEVSSGIV